MDNNRFKQSLGYFASGVSVITWGEENIEGITVSAFSSVSLNPPLILFCIDRRASIYNHLIQQETVAINILSEDQSQLAWQFAGKEHSDLSGHLEKNTEYNLFMLKNTHATLFVRLNQRLEGGDHDIFIAELLDSRLNPDSRPLLYHRGKIISETGNNL